MEWMYNDTLVKEIYYWASDKWFKTTYSAKWKQGYYLNPGLII